MNGECDAICENDPESAMTLVCETASRQAKQNVKEATSLDLELVVSRVRELFYRML